jgi:hypothetical protein
MITPNRASVNASYARGRRGARQLEVTVGRSSGRDLSALRPNVGTVGADGTLAVDRWRAMSSLLRK